MIHTGQMVKAGGSAPMRVIDIADGVAECIWIDGNGGIRRRFHNLGGLTPMWMALGPKSLWPDMTQIDLIAIEKEEREAAQVRKVSQRAARKARRSMKLNRKAIA